MTLTAQESSDESPDTTVETWLAWCATDRGLTYNTVATYRRSLGTLPHPATATREDVEAWWASRTHLSKATRNNELTAVRMFYKWCRVWGHREDDPTTRITPPKTPRGLPHPISRADLNRIMGSVDDELRRAVALGAYGGLRVSEAASLDWSAIDTETRRMYVTGKQATRVVGVSALLLDEVLPQVRGNVVRAGGSAYAASTLQRKVNRAFRAAGVEDATFHSLRHRFGTVALSATGNLLSVSRAMGHVSPATTAIYAATADSDLDVIAEAVAR